MPSNSDLATLSDNTNPLVSFQRFLQNNSCMKSYVLVVCHFSKFMSLKRWFPQILTNPNFHHKSSLFTFVKVFCCSQFGVSHSVKFLLPCPVPLLRAMTHRNTGTQRDKGNHTSVCSVWSFLVSQWLFMIEQKEGKETQF